MINFEKLERRLRVLSKRQNFIKSNKTITYSELQKLNELSKSYLSRYMSECIEGELNGEWQKETKSVFYNVEIKCEKCGEIYTETNVSKDGLISYIYEHNKMFAYWYYTCPKCKAKVEAEKHKQYEYKHSKEYKEQQAEIRKVNTEDYIKIYLNPEKSFKKEIKTFEKFTDITNYWNSSNPDELADYIKNMDYKDFLYTPYWDAVRSQKLYRSGYKCSLCDSNINLQVHHKTYEHHGYEHENLDDLIVLCGNCHSKHHGKGEN